jgi:HPt (histidine-containing phosphotransfer) domain-containing protein
LTGPNRGHTRAESDRDGPVRAALSSIGAHAQYANRVRADQLAAALTDLEAGTLTGAQREAAVRSAHQLAGSAGTFGHVAASLSASWFERFFSAQVPNTEQVAEAWWQLEELRRSLEEPLDLG